MKSNITLFVAILCVACSDAAPKDPSGDSAPGAVVIPDTAAALALRDSARATLAQLLTAPASATFDSIVVVQPPRIGNRLPAMAVCGRFGGRPGAGGSQTPTRFIFNDKWAVFVEASDNATEFAQLWTKQCAAPGATVVLRD